ncbi:MAG: flagellar basal body rod protein FlgC [Epulopiscium sp. Nele67-Bin005]|nr:MAG: flagellar basal body rod protein FlgC [Epulopiscium sp. Nele67-Bin005]
MSFFGSMDIATTGLTSQRLRLDIITQNIVNVNTTRTEDGGPYQRQVALFEAISDSNTFEDVLRKQVMGTSTNNEVSGGVRITGIVGDEAEFPVMYDPSHPDANEDGYVELPNVNIVDEMVDMISASRSYEASVTAFNNMKAMAGKALELGQ